ncbi:MAG TPA: hypothetical protein VG347_16750 [Verrucomicrobiae bacterium]|nr:hypothetical protein [Verrucomicrobiae bacterium]
MPDESLAVLHNDEICSLPKWARVVLAGRCVQRVFIAFAKWDTHGSYKGVGDTLKKCLESARLGNPQSGFSQVAQMAAEAARRDSMENAANVADTVVALVFATLRGAPKSALFCVTETEQLANNIFEDAMVFSDAFENDLKFLLRKSKELNWNDDAPINLEMLGKLWPFVEPEFRSPSAQRMGDFNPDEEFEIFLEMGSASTEAAARLLTAMSRLNIVAGGEGFEYISDGGYVFVRELEYA